LANLTQQQNFWVAEWQVKPALSVIEKEGTAVSLEPKVMAVLVTLASTPGEVFSRQELEDHVWQGTVVGYDALAKAINKLREALGDDKKNPHYIQTISKKGYRLVANVRVDSPHQPAQLGINKKKPAIARQWQVGIGLISALIVALLIFIYIQEKEADPVLSSHKLPITDDKPTVVVLPFRNISPNDKDDYLADGMTSDLTTNLSKLSSVWVTASTASLVYKNADISPEKIKQSFNARYVISGEVNKIGQAIRINVHLNDMDKGTILWAERYDREFTDLFAIQDEVTQKIINSLSLTLTNEEKHRIAKRYTNNMEAYETFLRAQFLLNARTPEDNIRAREMLQKAIELDPNFARAYASMSYSYAIGYLRQWPADTDHPLQKALQLANQALELDNELPEAYWATAFIYFYQTNIEEGNKLLQQALKLNPNYADAYALLAANAISQGNPERTLDYMANAYRLNPSGGYLYDMQLARAYYFLNNYDLALEYITSAIERNPVFIDLKMYMAAIYIQLKRYDEAGWMIIEAKQSSPDFDPRAWAMAYPYLDNKGYREKLLKDIELAETHSTN
jgi:TolB-like protein/DNA-binding winged helix-turn-helix (wHTH) protein/cytochrome c-type biogenesis protein CcmH/NrfG